MGTPLTQPHQHLRLVHCARGVDWWVKQIWGPPAWWQEMVVVPWKEGWKPQLLTKYVDVVCELPQVQFGQASDSYLARSPCLSVFKGEYYIPKWDASFASMDICAKARDKMLAFARSLQEWAE